MRGTSQSFFFALLTVLSTPLAAQNTTAAAGGCRLPNDPVDCKEALTFFHNLRAAVIANRRDVVAKMVDYPITVTIDDKPVPIKTPRSFIAHYDQIINPAERCAITQVKDSDVWGNSHGYTIDRGAIWWEKAAGENEAKSGQDIDWTKIPYRLLTINNINVMTEVCMKLNTIRTLSPGSPGPGKGIVLVNFQPAESFFSRLQQAVANGERGEIADMVLYPLHLRIAGKKVVAKDRVRFLELYDSVFKASTKAILQAERARDLTTWWEGIYDSKSLVRFGPISETRDFLITELADAPPKPAPIK
jgi:hypothetical protein